MLIFSRSLRYPDVAGLIFGGLLFLSVAGASTHAQTPVATPSPTPIATPTPVDTVPVAPVYNTPARPMPSAERVGVDAVD
ncbi:MAG: hypothetical protein ABJB40_06030, partial [Acidobacteriota bacterium]